MVESRLPGAGRARRRVGRAVVAWGAFLAVAASSPGAVTGAAASAAEPRGTAPRVDWTPCREDATAECGTLSVPVDWDRPDGPRFALGLARRTARDPDARVGSLVFGPGGPGDSGVRKVVEDHRFSDEVRDRFDVVGIDPRGVGRSGPVRCSTALLEERPSPVLTDQADFDAAVEYNRRLREDCRRHSRGLYDHVDTLQAVRDLDAVRTALGEERLTFHGSSYGTLLGQQYAEVFPHRVRAVVLESVVDHSLGRRRFLVTQAAAQQDSFDGFVAWCSRTESCALHGRDARAVWRGLLARAERGALTDPGSPGTRLDAFALSRVVETALKGPDRERLARYLAALDAGRRPAGSASPRRETPPEERPATEAHPFPAIFCQDWSLPVRSHREYAADLRRIARVAPDMRYPSALLGVVSCLGAPRPVNNPQHRLRVRGGGPLLLVNSLHDPVSSHDWAVRVARQLGDAGVLLTYEGWGHGAYGTGPCVTEAVDRYLVSRTLPAPGTTCPDVAAASP
ncbi:alpha/beta hydrolase [Streptomyces macrosporus]|uniref:Alpha/beta hydrolase n=1 Tax=Streptomyces macrosporus TaxID=44032 RepID=A0ABN3KS10_9ACTN